MAEQVLKNVRVTLLIAKKHNQVIYFFIFFYLYFYKLVNYFISILHFIYLLLYY